MKKSKKNSDEEKLYVASQNQLIWRKFKQHRLGVSGGVILIVFYIVALFCEFFAPYAPTTRHSKYVYCPPHRMRLYSRDGYQLRPFVYGLKCSINLKTISRTYSVDETVKNSISFFVRGDKYRIWNLFETDIHLFGVKEGVIFLFGTDKLGRDLFSRNIYAARISLSIGLIGVALSFLLGSLLGGISGYYGGSVDLVIQRVIEFLLSIPTIPLWMSLAAALPKDWSSIKTYFSITIILSLIGWCSLARVVRGKLLELREEDFVIAAKIAGASNIKIITRHLLPSFLSYLLVSLTLSVPRMILGETSLSFLGLGIRPPAVSWGTLMNVAQNLRTVVLHPWLLIPGLFVIAVVLSFNFLGDGLRDAADPYM